MGRFNGDTKYPKYKDLARHFVRFGSYCNTNLLEISTACDHHGSPTECPQDLFLTDQKNKEKESELENIGNFSCHI